MKIIAICCFTLFTMLAHSREIALTFDDAPMGDGAFMSGDQRTSKLISILKKSRVESVMLFANTVHMDERGRARIQRYAKAGHYIANHSHSHRSASKIGVARYLSDVDEAHKILAEFDNFLPYHRFPYLNHGADKKAITAIDVGLKRRGYKDGYVTVDNFDFYLNHLMSEAVNHHRAFDMAAAEYLYVETVWQAIEFYDALAQQYIGRSPKHVLLLHENDAAALFLPALIDKIKAEGWSIITPQAAYADPIAKPLPLGNIHNQGGRIAEIAKRLGAKSEELRQRRENTDVLDALFKERVLKSRHDKKHEDMKTGSEKRHERSAGVIQTRIRRHAGTVEAR